MECNTIVRMINAYQDGFDVEKDHNRKYLQTLSTNMRKTAVKPICTNPKNLPNHSKQYGVMYRIKHCNRYDLKKKKWNVNFYHS